MKKQAQFLWFSFQKQIVWKLYFDLDYDKHVVSMRQISVNTGNKKTYFSQFSEAL